MKKKTKPRKPRDLRHDPQYEAYAGFEDYCYIGGPYYCDSAQIHLKNTEDIRRLHKYLGKLIEYLDAKERA